MSARTRLPSLVAPSTYDPGNEQQFRAAIEDRLVSIESGDATDLAAGTIPAARMPALTGDVTSSAGSVATTIANNAVTTAKIIDDAVTFAKMQNIATDRLLGRDTAASGNVEEITVGGGLEFTGAGGVQRSALTGDVTASAGNNATTIANDAVTYAKLQNVSAASRLLGRGSAGGAGDVEEIVIEAGLAMSGTTLVNPAALLFFHQNFH